MGELQDFDYYQKQINKHIVEMKLDRAPLTRFCQKSKK